MVHINRNVVCTEYRDKNVGPNYTIVFGRFEVGVLEIEGERPHNLKKVWRKYDASIKHRVTKIHSGIRVSLTAFHKVESSEEKREKGHFGRQLGSRSGEYTTGALCRGRGAHFGFRTSTCRSTI